MLDALHIADTDPEKAYEICRTIGRKIHDDCLLAAVEKAQGDLETDAWCDEMSTTVYRDECFFLSAERHGDFGACEKAGKFADDCRLHVWSKSLPKKWPGSMSMSDGVVSLRKHMEEWGISPSDPRYWSAAFRHRYMGQIILDRQECETLSDPDLFKACWSTGRVVFQDKLFRERDFFGPFPCPGAVPSPRLRHSPDPELDQLFADLPPHPECVGAPLPDEKRH